MNDTMVDSLDVPILFGRFLVLLGLVSEQDITEAATVQRELNASPLFPLVEQGIMSVESIKRARKYQREHMVTFCQATHALGILSEQECTAMFESVAQHRVQIGDVLVKQGKLSREQLEAALTQHRRHQENNSQDLF